MRNVVQPGNKTAPPVSGRGWKPRALPAWLEVTRASGVAESHAFSGAAVRGQISAGGM